VAVVRLRGTYPSPPPASLSSRLSPLAGVAAEGPRYPSLAAAVAGASAAVLEQLYPDDMHLLEEKATSHQESCLWAGAALRSDVEAGDSVGRAVAAVVVRHAADDGASAVWRGTPPRGQGLWTPAEHRPPLGPLWGRVRPWLMKHGAQFRATPPPAYGSTPFLEALAEVRRLSDTRTREQARIAALWADGIGSYTPPGRWNKIAADLIVKHAVSEARAARVLALVNMTLMDAGIACWETKFHYWFPRPYQADRSISTPVGQPDFPSYTSAHATFSGAGAGVLGHLFPSEKASIEARGQEAAFSRLCGGIHYRFDSDLGAAQGHAVARLAIERNRADGAV
jgi:membrane-associated phospholipid phosphatase